MNEIRFNDIYKNYVDLALKTAVYYCKDKTAAEDIVQLAFAKLYVNYDEIRNKEAIGAWLEINGEAIYGSKVWRKYGEGPTQVTEGQFSDGIKKEFTSEDIRYTMNGDKLYAIVMRCSQDGSYTFPALGKQDASHKPNFAGIIGNVSALGFDGACEWSRDEEGLHVKADGMKTDKPVVFKVELL